MTFSLHKTLSTPESLIFFCLIILFLLITTKLSDLMLVTERSVIQFLPLFFEQWSIHVLLGSYRLAWVELYVSYHFWLFSDYWHVLEWYFAFFSVFFLFLRLSFISLVFARFHSTLFFIHEFLHLLIFFFFSLLMLFVFVDKVHLVLHKFLLFLIDLLSYFTFRLIRYQSWLSWVILFLFSRFANHFGFF